MRLIIPYYGFVLGNRVIFSLFLNPDSRKLLFMVKQGLLGIRNNIFASSLWFIPCLFVMYVVYSGLARIVKNKYLSLMIAVAVYFLSRAFLPSQPSWFWNIDSALSYLVYYAAGAAFADGILNYRVRRQIG